jgi:glutamate-5-semialdehyde dehydrogenase
VGDGAQDWNLLPAEAESAIAMAKLAEGALTTRTMLEQARTAAPCVAGLPTVEKNGLLTRLADAIEGGTERILAANREDMELSGRNPEMDEAMRDRLLLTRERVAAMAAGVRDVALLLDPVGEVLAEWERPNGLRIRKVRVPLGVIGIIYEARPNVTVDTLALALKTGNAVVLRGSKEAANSNQCLVEIMAGVPGMPDGAIHLLDASSRDSVRELIEARGLVDVIIPRGGAGLITFVVENSLVPVIETGAGNCHIYVDESADLDMADQIVINAKTQRPSVCNAAEKLLVHEQIAAIYVPRIAAKLREQGVELRGDEAALRLSTSGTMQAATEADWGEEYLRLCMAIRVVRDLEQAIEHINRYSTKHSDAIVTRDESHARRFLRAVDSAAVYWNASTRFSDGAEFGFGAEMGVSTQKLHCRGPFALAELTSSKYEVIGNGQIR